MSVDLFEEQHNRAYIYTPELAQALVFEKQQLDFNWRADEILVENDKHALLTETTPAERHGLLTVLKTFTHYEVRAGNDYWLGRVLNTFAPLEIKRLATVNGFMENVVHAPFYNKVNEVLFVDNAAFYNEYLKDPILADHMQFIGEIINHENLLLSLAMFSLIEGAALYSAFAVLKAFRSNGYNKMTNIASGVNFSERDEALHSAAGAWLYNITRKYGKVAHKQSAHPHPLFEQAVKRLVSHEDHIIKLVFEQGEFCGITQEDTKTWVRERVNHCLKQLRLPAMYDINRSQISGWFENQTKGVTLSDFFDTVPKYTGGWPVEGFDFSGLVEA
jgi:ribonucleotide reductase beta subunit family protein with ferritin-like domain